MARKPIFIILILTVVVCLPAQEPPRIAVVPFNPVGVSESDASVITSLFETALVQTESFNVIEQNQISDIMEAQAYTMTGCTDESCAIEVGKLLAAEQIILGELSTIGGKFILNAKIIDVQEGRNIKADKVEAAGMGDMTDAAELLAYKLAGLTFTSGGDVQVAQAFGEAMIETSPAGADIYINGVKKGTSPDLITRIPLGTIRVEARKGNLYALKEVDVSAETARISLTLEEQYGNLFIKSSDPAVDVYLDGSRLGALGSGFFDNLAVGDHTLELKGADVYWTGDITLEAGKSTRVEAYPRGFGYLQYSLPDQVQGEITGTQFRQVLHGSGTIQLYEGQYSIKATGNIYQDIKESIKVTRGQQLSFKPQMEFTPEHIQRLAEERRTEEFNRFSKGIAEMEGMLETDYPVQQNDLADLQDLGNSLQSSEFSFPDLVQRWEVLQKNLVERKGLQESLAEYLAQKAELELQITTLAEKKKGHTTGGWIALGTGSASAVLSVASFIISWISYQNYLEAGIDEWEELKNRYQTWDLVGYASAGTAAIGGGLTPLLWMTGPKENERSSVVARLATVQSEIDRIESVLAGGVEE